MAVIHIIIILLSDKKAGLSKSQIGRDGDQLSGNLHTCPPHNVPPQGFVKSAPKYLSKRDWKYLSKPGRVWRNEERTKMKGGPTELHGGWNDRFFSWETFFEILNELSRGDRAGERHFWQVKVVTKVQKSTWSNDKTLRRTLWLIKCL